MGCKKIIIFTGPSLSHDEARRILKADYRPPVKRGDVLEALRESPDIIGIIDGVFHQSPAVGHREIIEAIRRGVTVVGGSSMGALRASELSEIGMIGVGYVFRAYISGDIESDDDVAVVFNPDTFEALSDSLVSMELNFRLAFEKGVVGKSDYDNLIKTAKDLFYPKRNYKRVLRDAKLDEEVKRSLEVFLEKYGFDVKREDAIKVLRYIKDLDDCEE